MKGQRGPVAHNAAINPRLSRAAGNHSLNQSVRWYSTDLRTATWPVRGQKNSLPIGRICHGCGQWARFLRSATCCTQWCAFPCWAGLRRPVRCRWVCDRFLCFLVRLAAIIKAHMPAASCNVHICVRGQQPWTRPGALAESRLLSKTGSKRPRSFRPLPTNFRPLSLLERKSGPSNSRQTLFGMLRWPPC